ncbi:hypothetical protein ACN28I_30950 [Archangium gephyra]|uniref:hypothetical protein n=1 Tax=Archangium gephyra TaxID=48 RepID=UPI003B78DAC6
MRTSGEGSLTRRSNISPLRSSAPVRRMARTVAARRPGSRSSSARFATTWKASSSRPRSVRATRAAARCSTMTGSYSRSKAAWSSARGRLTADSRSSVRK